MNQRRVHGRRAGFTLIEVLLVLAILVILGSLAVGLFTRTQQSANVKAAQSQIGLFKTPIETFHLDLNQYPASLEDLIAPPANLPNAARWMGPYLDARAVPLDPWGNPYQYAVPGTRNPDRYDVWSMGPDRVDGTDDDIGNW